MPAWRALYLQLACPTGTTMNASDTKQAPRPLSRGEARIRRAFILSLVLIVSLAVAGIILYWLRHPPAEEQPVGEARVDAPSLPAPVPTPDQPPRGGVHDITESAGIGLVHVIGAYRERLMAETIGSGVAFIAYDRDGDQDLLLVNSRYWEGHEVEGATHTGALWQRRPRAFHGSHPKGRARADLLRHGRGGGRLRRRPFPFPLSPHAALIPNRPTLPERTAAVRRGRFDTGAGWEPWRPPRLLSRILRMPIISCPPSLGIRHNHRRSRPLVLGFWGDNDQELHWR